MAAQLRSRTTGTTVSAARWCACRRPASRASAICSAASSNQFGDTPPPTHRPIRNGSVPQVASSPRRSTSAAHTSAAARWNCCAVSSRSVYRMSTATPASPPRASTPVPTSPGGGGSRMCNAVSPRYASVLPPPVGKNSRSTMAVWSAARSGCAGSVSDGRFSSTNASWNGRHDAAAAPWPSTGRLASAYDRPCSSRSRPISVCRRCSAIAALAKRNAASASAWPGCSGSVSSSIPARIRVGGTPRREHGRFSRGRSGTGSSANRRLLLVQPVGVPVGQRQQAGAQLARSAVGERVHRQLHRASGVPSPTGATVAGHVVGRQPGRLQPVCAPLAVATSACTATLRPAA